MLRFQEKALSAVGLNFENTGVLKVGAAVFDFAAFDNRAALVAELVNVVFGVG